MRRGIYRIRNVATDDCYVGQAQNIEKRWAYHRHRLAQGVHHSHRLQRAWDTFGADAFAWEVVEEIEPPRGLDAAEARHIRALPSTYNVGIVPEKTDTPVARDLGLRTQEQECTVIRHKTRCPGCGKAVEIEERVYPGLGRIVDIFVYDSKTSDWRLVSTDVIRDVERGGQ